METQRMLCAVGYFQHHSSCAPPFTVPPRLPLNFDPPPMQTLPVPLGGASSWREGYFPVSPMSTTRQRTAQACDKCRERKTKCSGDKPVCQRCANRGLICEYTSRAPRMRGLPKTRFMSISTPPLNTGDEKQGIALLPSRTRGNCSQESYPAIIPAESTSYVTSFANFKHSISSTPNLGAETIAHTVMHYPSWADIRPRPSTLQSDFGGPQRWVTAPQESIKIECNPYPPSEHPQKRYNSLPNDILHSTSSFIFKGQENPRYNNNDYSSSYHYSTYRPASRLAEPSLSGSSGSSSPGYHSGSTLSSSAPTSPFYSQELSEGSAPSEAYGGLAMNDYHRDTTGKHIHKNNDVVSVNHSYCSKDAEVQQDWSMSDNAVTGGGQAPQNLGLSGLWM